VKKARFKHALCSAWAVPAFAPEVLRLTFGKIKGFPELHVLDSTDPAQIRAIEAKGTSRAPSASFEQVREHTRAKYYKQYFFERVKAKVGEKEVGNCFIAVTDPGSKMQQVAETDKFRKIFFGVPSIGGRYSAISNFGMVPAAVMGLDVAKFLKNTRGNGQSLWCIFCRRFESWRHSRNHHGRRRQSWPRQNHHHRFSGNLRPRRVA